MRALLFAVVVFACSSPAKSTSTAPTSARDSAAPTPAGGTTAPTESATQSTAAEQLTADAPRTTVAGNTFVAPGGWSLSVRGTATILTAPEGDSSIALVDIASAGDADAALKAAWTAYTGGVKWPVTVANDLPPRDGWSERRTYAYDVPPNQKRAVQAVAQRANGSWTVLIFDVTEAVAEKRIGEIQTALGRLLPKGGKRESFAGRNAHALDAERIAALGKFVESAQQALGVPGVAIGLIDHGKVVFSGGFGVRALGKPAKVDRNTLFMIGSTTKALTTLLLAKLVDANKLTWDSQVTSVMPAFKLGDAATTKSVLVKHLICACTGLPRNDLEWIFQYKGVTAAGEVTALGKLQPTSKFGEMFQYSNALAAVAGYVAAHVVNPRLELGASYDRAMKSLVFDPLDMKSTTFDYARALAGNVAQPHATTLDDKLTAISNDLNYAVVPLRPAGAAWSSVDDMLKYVAMELAEGALPSGKRYITKDALLARRAPQVAIGKDASYGMGLVVDSADGIPVVHHNGATFGYQSDALWLPEQGIGAVVLTNSANAGPLPPQFRRKLLELVFDGEPHADAAIASIAKATREAAAAQRKQLTIPPDDTEVALLAPRYRNADLGEVTVRKAGGKTLFDMGEWKIEVATRKNADGTTSFVTIGAALIGLDFVTGTTSAGRPSLTIRDAQHEYVFEAD